MSLRDDLETVNQAVKERRGLKRFVGQLVKQNTQEQKSERIVNSAISELMNLFSAIRESNASSGRDIDGMIIKPRDVAKNVKGTEKDPRVLIRAAQEDPDFDRTFKVETQTDDKGEETYILRRRKVSELFGK